MSMSLDGYIADLNDGVAEVFDWFVVQVRGGRRRPSGVDSTSPS
jgi:hypothetical protein